MRVSGAMCNGKDLGWKISQLLELANEKGMSASQGKKREEQAAFNKILILRGMRRGQAVKISQCQLG